MNKIFTEKENECICALGEEQLIKNIKAWLGAVTPEAPYGIGDDCAVVFVPQESQQIITTDALTYGIHFDDSISGQQAGAKLIKRNLSDIAAMGGQPNHATLALISGDNLSSIWLREFFKGIQRTCDFYNISLLGGDVSSSTQSQFSAILTLLGHTESPKLRSGASIGDQIYVTGQLGGSLLGKHHAFTPRLNEGQWLAMEPNCTAMMDITDGLAKDLKCLLPTGACAELKLDEIPVSSAADTIAVKSGTPAIQHAFCDGEDYELAFTMRTIESSLDFEKRWIERFPDVKISRIGQLSPRPSVDSYYIDAKTKQALPKLHGFEHFVCQ